MLAPTARFRNGQQRVGRALSSGKHLIHRHEPGRIIDPRHIGPPLLGDLRQIVDDHPPRTVKPIQERR